MSIAAKTVGKESLPSKAKERQRNHDKETSTMESAIDSEGKAECPVDAGTLREDSNGLSSIMDQGLKKDCENKKETRSERAIKLESFESPSIKPGEWKMVRMYFISLFPLLKPNWNVTFAGTEFKDNTSLLSWSQLGNEKNYRGNKDR